MNQAVKDNEINIANNAKKNPKLVYSYVNSKKVVKENIRALIDENGMRSESPSEITRILNKQFESVFDADNGERPAFERGNREYDWGEINDVKEGMIREKIKNLNEFKAFSVKKVCNVVLKNPTDAFLKTLKLIFDKSLSTGEAPKELPNLTLPNLRVPKNFIYYKNNFVKID